MAKKNGELEKLLEAREKDSKHLHSLLSSHGMKGYVYKKAEKKEGEK